MCDVPMAVQHIYGWCCERSAVNVGVPLWRDGSEWKMPVLLFADDTVLLSDKEWELQSLVSVFGHVCEKRNLKVNVGKSKVMVFERDEVTNCEVWLNNQVMENVSSFKYLGSMMSKEGSIEDDVHERVQQGKKVAGTLNAVIRNRAVSMEVKKSLHDSVVIPTLTYRSGALALLGRHKSRLRGVEMSYLRSACGVTWRDRLTNEEVREHCGVEVDVLEYVERNTLRWFGHMERMTDDRLTKRVYESVVEGRGRRGRPRMRWKDGVKKCLSDSGVE